jgi:O-antigen/teichoic acid export membrane protein
VKEIALATVKFGSGQAISLLCAAVAVKIMALTIGPAGVGLFSLLRQAQQTLGALATFGGQNAVVQGIASRSGIERDRFMISILWAFVAGSLALGALTIVLSVPLALVVIPADALAGPTLLRWIAFPVIAGALLVFVRGILNAHMLIGSVAWTNVVTAGSLIVLVYPAVVAYQAGHQVALVLLLGGSLTMGLLFAAFQARTSGCLIAFARTGPGIFDVTAIRNFLSVALPSLVALFAGMASVLAVRALIAHWHGLPAAGLFDSAWSISTMYLAVFLTALHSYLLPALSANTAQEPSQDVLDRALRLAIIVSVPLIVALIVLKPLAVRVLYSGEFLPALELLRWTLFGDYLRVGGWVLATTLFARADMRAYLACELAWNATFIAVAFWLAREGFEGAGPAYVAAYSVYLATLVFRTQHHHRYTVTARFLVTWIAGMGVVLLAVASTWNDSNVVWPKTGLIALGVLTSWLAVSPAEKQAVGNRLARMFAH